MPSPGNTPERFTLRLDVRAWNELNAAAGLVTEAEQAAHIGIARGTLNRIRNGHAAPGPEFIAAVRVAFPHVATDRLLAIVPKAA